MFFVRLLLLGLLTLFTYAMGSIPGHEANGIAKFFGPLFFVAAPALYFLPTLEAKMRGHHNIGSIAAVNAFLGWTLIGWVVALTWALAKPQQVQAVSPAEQPPAPQPLSAPVLSGEQSASVIDQLTKLAALVEKGLLTAEEFAAQKAQLLASNSPAKAHVVSAEASALGVVFKDERFMWQGNHFKELDDAVAFARRHSAGR